MASTNPSPSTLRVERSATTLVLSAIDALLIVRMERPILDQRSARMVREQAVEEEARPLLRDLAGGAEDLVGDVAFTAPSRVEDGSEPVRGGLGAGELLDRGRRSCTRRPGSPASWASSSGIPGCSQNSSAKPLAPPSKPVGASRGPDCVWTGSLPPTTNIDGTAHTAISDRTLNRVIRITRILSVVTGCRRACARRSHALAENRLCRAPMRQRVERL